MTHEEDDLRSFVTRRFGSPNDAAEGSSPDDWDAVVHRANAETSEASPQVGRLVLVGLVVLAVVSSVGVVQLRSRTVELNVASEGPTGPGGPVNTQVDGERGTSLPPPSTVATSTETTHPAPTTASTSEAGPSVPSTPVPTTIKPIENPPTSATTSTSVVAQPTDLPDVPPPPDDQEFAFFLPQGPVDPNSSTLTVNVGYVNCGGEAPGDRIKTPVIIETDDAIVVAFYADPPSASAPGSGSTCSRGPTSTTTLQLPKPVGHRWIYDGAYDPPVPVYRP